MKKRRVFDLDLPDDEPETAGGGEAFPAGKASDALETRSALGLRPGPMATAVQENAKALRTRAEQEASIRAENDVLAAEFVRLKKAGLVVDLVPVELIDATKLNRDRARVADMELADLKLSIKEIGLSNPIQVEPAGQGRFELIQGMRRLIAFRELLAETKDARFAHIPAGIMARGASLEGLYRRMVDENLVRKDISFAEMADLARSYAADPGTSCDDSDKAVSILFQSAGYSKRSYIRAFAALLDRLGDYLDYPQEIPRKLGLDLRRKLELEPGIADCIIRDLKGWDNRSITDELGVLRTWAGDTEEGETFPAGKKAKPALGEERRAKVTFQLSRPEGVAKCTAANGRLELRLPVDFSTIDRRRLEMAMKALLETLK